MKKIFAMFLAIITVLALSFAFAACADNGDSISRVFVNEDKKIIVEYASGETQILGSVKDEESEKPKTVLRTYLNIYDHLIVEYSDHTKEDLGLITPKKITVTFVDSEDNVISTVETYAGLSINAPEAPEKEDETFIGWDTDLTDISSDVTVKAIYKISKTYTVRFVDDDDTLLKEQIVLAGSNATPPNLKEKAGYTFEGWVGDYLAVTSDRTVTATYRLKGTYFVTFKDYNGLTLKVDNVKEKGTAVPPEDPVREGYTFTGWSASYNNIKADKTVIARYKFASDETENVFDIKYNVDENNIYLTLCLDGVITLSNFSGTLSFDGMTLVDAQSSVGTITVNTEENSISISFSIDAEMEKGTVILTATLDINSDEGRAELNITECLDKDLSEVPFTVIGQDMRLK